MQFANLRFVANTKQMRTNKLNCIWLDLGSCHWCTSNYPIVFDAPRGGLLRHICSWSDVDWVMVVFDLFCAEAEVHCNGINGWAIGNRSTDGIWLIRFEPDWGLAHLQDITRLRPRQRDDILGLFCYHLYRQLWVVTGPFDMHKDCHLREWDWVEIGIGRPMIYSLNHGQMDCEARLWLITHHVNPCAQFVKS